MRNPIAPRVQIMLFAFGMLILLVGRLPLEAQSCPHVPSGGGQSIQAFVTRKDNGCQVRDGMYVKKSTAFRPDSVATADGQCTLRALDCSPLPCECVVIGTQERTINHINIWEDVNAPPPDGTDVVGYMFGRDPATGHTAFYHVLDSRQSNSTGPISFTPFYAGEYLLHFQAPINTTSCNKLPNATDLIEMLMHARSALHKGAPNNGSLDGGISLTNFVPQAQRNGWYHYPGSDTPGTDDWGGQEAMHQVIKNVGVRWYNFHLSGPRMGVLDISRQRGSPFSPHSSHQNGLDVDVRYVRNDNNEESLNLSTQQQYYSRALTIELLKELAYTARVELIIVDPAANISSADVPGVQIIIDLGGGHRDHFHVRIFDPDGPDSNNC